MEDMDLPLDLRDLLCGQDGCTAPYPCSAHQAFESAAIAPPFLMCETGSSDAPTRGCTTLTECRARGACAKPLAPLPSFPMPMEQEQAPELYCGKGGTPTAIYRDSAAPTAPINDRPTMPLPGRQQQRAAMWDRMEQEHRARQAAAETARQLAQAAAETEAEEENTPTRPLPRLCPESGHGAEVMEPPPPPRCPKCNSVMVDGDEFNAPICLSTACF